MVYGTIMANELLVNIFNGFLMIHYHSKTGFKNPKIIQPTKNTFVSKLYFVAILHCQQQ